MRRNVTALLMVVYILFASIFFYQANDYLSGALVANTNTANENQALGTQEQDLEVDSSSEQLPPSLDQEDESDSSPSVTSTSSNSSLTNTNQTSTASSSDTNSRSSRSSGSGGSSSNSDIPLQEQFPNITFVDGYTFNTNFTRMPTQNYNLIPENKRVTWEGIEFEEGVEYFEMGRKHTNNSELIMVVDEMVTCTLRPNSIDDRWKYCESIFEIQDGVEQPEIYGNASFVFSFVEENIADPQIWLSDKYFWGKEEYIYWDEENLKEVRIPYDTRKFYGFSSSPKDVNTSGPIAIKLTYKAPRYTSNQFNFSITAPNFFATIDPTQSGCGIINSAGVYTLDQDVSSSATCFPITADHVLINCDGNTINYSTTTAGRGIYAADRENVSIQNCVITHGNTSALSSIEFSNVSDSTLLDNTISLTAQSVSSLLMTNISNVNIRQNSVSTNGSSSPSLQLEQNSAQTMIINNTFNSISHNEITDNSYSSTNNTLTVNNAFGLINWTQNNLTYDGNLSVGALVTLESNLIAFDSGAGREQLNSSASLHFYGLSAYSSVNVLKNGVLCSGCSSSKSGGTWHVGIASFSNYSLQDTTPGEPIPEWEDYAVLLILLVVVGGFYGMRKE